MKMTLTILMLTITLRTFAPAAPQLYIILDQPINRYDPLVRAIYKVETASGKFLYNPEEEATGPFQIRPIRLQDYNKRTGKTYTLQQMYDWNISLEIFLYYTEGKTFEWVARDWNGSGEATKEYWKKVQACL